MFLNAELGYHTELMSRSSYKPAVVAGRYMLHLQNLDYLGWIANDLLTVSGAAQNKGKDPGFVFSLTLSRFGFSEGHFLTFLLTSQGLL